MGGDCMSQVTRARITQFQANKSYMVILPHDHALLGTAAAPRPVRRVGSWEAGQA